MKKLTKKIMTIAGTATLAVGLMALPVLADTTQPQRGRWLGQMQEYMQKSFSPEEHQTLMNSKEMQNLHNSQGMQDAMRAGDFSKMQELMNSDSAFKAQMGQENLDKMNEFMSNHSGSMM